VVQLKVLSGKKAGTSWMARRFPVRIGRAQDCDLRLEDAGVWDQHLTLRLAPATGFSVKGESNALVRLNGEPISEAVLRNGDLIELGAARVQFWLSPVRQRALGLREALSWGVILAATAGQVYILYWLLA
jgi:pSer/pThr/pTyr-binding forkhead associated (FHA) protein